ncbi:MAG: amidohydrolase family protein [Anaerolineae bacterium]
MLVLKEAKVVTGDGVTVLDRATVLVGHGRIVDIIQGDVAQGVLEGAQRVIDCAGRLLMPGVINHHTHGCHYGPLWPSASPTLPEEQVQYHLDKHLLGGSTTILNICGFATVEDVAAASAAHPLQVKSATSYTPACVEAANAVDGSGFAERHRGITVEQQIEAGALAIAEVGGGMTLAGGGQEYHFIPRAVKQATGKTIETPQARKLKEAVIGHFADPADYDPQALARALEETGLAEDLTVEQAKELILRTVMPSLGPALKGFEEAVAEAKRFQVRAIFHNAPQAMRKLQEVAKIGGDLVVAAHSNHPNFDPEEALENARILRQRGAIIDVATLDLWGGAGLSAPSHQELFYEFYRQGLVDTISTDFAGGHFDGVLVGVENAVKVGAASLPAVVATATSRVASYFPRLAPERGLIARDKIADLVVTDPVQISKVQHVLIGGRVVVENGKRV